MNYRDIQHRFANKLEGKNGCIKAGNVRYEGRNFYSYSTIFGQWVDIEKNVCVIFDGSTSVSSSKHKLWKGVFPDDVHVFPLDFGSNSYYGWRNCDLLGWRNGFEESHRMQMLDHYVERIYDHIAAIKDGKKKGLEKVDFTPWDYVEELCSLYKDTSIAKYIKWTKNKDYKKLVKLLKDGERNVETLTDALFGEGTFEKYWNYCERYRKSENKRAKIETLCARLGIASPYESSWRGGCLDSGLTADQIRKLTAKERLDLHFASIMRDEERKGECAVKDKYNKNFRNAYKWIVGYEPTIDKWNGRVHEHVNKCLNMFTSEEYDLDVKDWHRTPSWTDFRVTFNYDAFRKSENKREWVEKFYEKCELVARNVFALTILREFNAEEEQRGRYSWTKAYVLTDEVMYKLNGCAESIAIVGDYIARQDKYFEDEVARERAERIARERAETERKAEEEYQKQVKQEQIDECLRRGLEGCRDLWRKHLQPIDTARLNAPDTDDAFFYHGNVLLRLNLNKDKVETSKNIRIPIEVGKEMWKIVSKWHENPASFKEMRIDTKGSGAYTISSYEDDILTAGCHKIAYTEMERMCNEIAAV